MPLDLDVTMQSSPRSAPEAAHPSGRSAGEADQFARLVRRLGQSACPEERAALAAQIEDALPTLRPGVRLSSRIAAILSSPLDPHAVLTTLASLFVPELADFCFLDRFEDGQLIRVGFAHTDATAEARFAEQYAAFPPRVPPGPGYLRASQTGWTERSGSPPRLDELALDEPFLAFLASLDPTSFAIVPLRHLDRPLGFVTMFAGRPRTSLSSERIEEAELLSRIASSVIANALLFKEEERAHRHAELMGAHLAAQGQLTAALARPKRVCQITELFLSAGLSAVGAQFGCLALARPGGTDLEVFRAPAGGLPLGPPFVIPAAADGAMAAAFRSGEPVFDEPAGDPRPEHRAGTAPVAARAFLPLIVEGRPLGVVELGFAGQVRRFDSETRAWLLSVTSQLAVILERARLLEAEQAAHAAAEAVSRRAVFLAEVSDLLASETNAEVALSVLAGMAVPFFADASLCFLADDNGKPRRVGAFASDPRRLALLHAPKEELTFWWVDRGPVAQAAARGEPTHVWDFARQGVALLEPGPEHREALEAFAPTSVLHVPMLLPSGRLAGVLVFVTAESGRRFSEEERDFALEVARRTAAALDNARLRRAIEEGGHRYRALASAVPDIVWTATPDGVLDYCNDRGVSYLGVSVTQMASREHELVHPDDLAAVGAAVEVAQRASALVECECRLRRASDSTWRWHLIRAQPLVGSDGRPIKWFGAATDIDDQKRAAQALEKSQLELAEAVRVRDDFLSAASHELKTPLTALQMQVGHMARRQRKAPGGAVPPEELAALLAALDRQGRRLGKLVDNLLDVSRLSSGRLQLDLDRVDCAQVLREVVGRFQSEIDERGSAVTIESPEALVGRWDAVRIDQIASNLLSNALRYGEGKPVALRLARDGEWAELSVIDQGIGISLEDQGLLFERFERASAPRHLGGLGLGLWIVRQLVATLGGSVRLTSATGQGSTFTVRLPLAGPGEPVARSAKG